jgi:uncharacterized protein (DUF2461 family)
MNTIKKETLGFLKELSKNNNKDWFDANRETYQNAKKNFEEFLEFVLIDLIKIDPELNGLEV